MQLVTKAEYARRHNVSRAAVGKWVQEGRIIVVDDRVDLETSDARLAESRHPRAVMRAEQRAKTAAGIVSMKPRDISERLAKLDWKIEHDFSETGVDARAKKAAQCLGWQATTSDLRDDGHYGGYQLRESGKEGRAAVISGFGFELTATDVILTCRHEIEPEDYDDDFKIAVLPELFPSLALPLWQRQVKANN